MLMRPSPSYSSVVRYNSTAVRASVRPTYGIRDV
jgi:hypothetical protein